MKMTKLSVRSSRQTGLLWMILTLIILCYAKGSVAQQRYDSSPQVEIKVLSAQVTKFEKPIRIGPPRRMIEYSEALVLQLEVDRNRFDSLPPDMEPFLYIGRNEYHIFAIDRQDNRQTLILTFHIRNWTQVRDNSPMVLTIDHGTPLRNPEIFERQRGPRFNKTLITGRPG
jgi:hypothetical protein